MPRKISIRTEKTPSAPAAEQITTIVTFDAIPAGTLPVPAPKPIPIGQQVKITKEFKGPRGVIRSGTATIIEGHQVRGDKLQYKILHRGFRFWVPGEIVESL